VSETSTITSIAGDAGDGHLAPRGACPQLVMIATAEDLRAPSWRHLLADFDEVRFGRGDHAIDRRLDRGLRVLELRLPDARMSRDNGSLVRRLSGWHLVDRESKNGAVVDAVRTRDAAVRDGAVIELGHTFFVFRNAPVEPNAPAYLDADGLAGRLPALRTFDGELAERFALLERIAPTEVSVLLQGETGTGKELIARALHALSGRKGELVPVNCGALPQQLIEAELFGYKRGAFTGAIGERVGLVRSADHGTLFLDEVGELPVASQATFLRVLQEREVVPIGFDHPVKVDVRLCSATLRKLDDLVERGQFRRDLFARLFGLTVELPPLRARRGDLGLLIRAVLAGVAGGAGVRLAPVALRALLHHDWPFNIRELEKVLTTAVALAPEGIIELAHLPEALRLPPGSSRPVPAVAAPPPVAPSLPDPGPPSGPIHSDTSLDRFLDDSGDGARPGPRGAAIWMRDHVALRARLVELLALHQGNVVAVSKAMEVRRTQIYRWLERFELDPEAYRKKPES
jgi:DNA-binding NtrC family response regulator